MTVSQISNQEFMSLNIGKASATKPLWSSTVELTTVMARAPSKNDTHVCHREDIPSDKNQSKRTTKKKKRRCLVCLPNITLGTQEVSKRATFKLFDPPTVSGKDELDLPERYVRLKQIEQNAKGIRHQPWNKYRRWSHNISGWFEGESLSTQAILSDKNIARSKNKRCVSMMCFHQGKTRSQRGTQCQSWWHIKVICAPIEYYRKVDE